MTHLTELTLSAIIVAAALVGATPADAGFFTGTITNERASVVDHRDDRPNEVVISRRGTDPASEILPTDPITPPSNGGINPIGDVSCFDGQLILWQDDFEVYYSDCSKYIYNFRAIAQNVIVDIHMSSFDGTYNTNILGFAD